MLYFRIQRELQMQASSERIWLPWADRLLVASTLISLLLVILPILLFDNLRLASAAAVTATVLLAGYVLAILAHYRIAFDRELLFVGKRRYGPRDNPEPAEQILVIFSSICGLLALVVGLLAT